MSCPQQSGDFTLPSPFGHLETWTLLPSSFWIESCSSAALHLLQVMLTPIPHLSHVYVAMGREYRAPAHDLRKLRKGEESKAPSFIV